MNGQWEVGEWMSKDRGGEHMSMCHNVMTRGVAGGQRGVT